MGATESTPTTNGGTGDCCPPEGEEFRTALEAGATEAPVGRVERVRNPGVAEGGADETVKVYVVEPPKGGASVRGGVVVFHDIFGWGAGRTFHLADELAKAGYVVVVPDFFGKELEGFRTERDALWPPWKIVTGGAVFAKRGRMPWPQVQQKLTDVVLPLVRGLCNNGPLAAIGFCWGGWAVFRAAGMDPCPFVCAAGVHPSPHIQMLQSEGPTFEQCVRDVRIPLFLAPTWTDPTNLRDDGWIMQYLRENALAKDSQCFLYTDRIHGFAPRGDIRDPAIKKDVDDLLHRVTDFYAARGMPGVVLPPPPAAAAAPSSSAASAVASDE